MRLAIGIIFNGNDPGHERLLSSIKLATAALEKSGSSVVVIGKRIGAISSLDDKTVEFIGDTVNRGFGVSHNQMMREAFINRGAEYYLCLNDDVILAPDSLLKAVCFLSGQEGLVLAESMQVPCEHPKPYDPLTLKTNWCSGAAMFISQGIFKLTNGFDENLFMYCEDVDLSWRARLFGAECFILPFSRVFHRVKPQGEKPKTIVKQMFESARYLGYKWGAIAFQEHFEEKLVKGGFYPDRVYLPSLPRLTQRLTPSEFSEFRQELAFGLSRWG